MTEATQQVLESALRLSNGERAELVSQLAASLRGKDVFDSGDPEVVDAWRTEIRRRWEEYQRGEVEPIDGPTVFHELYARLGK